MIGTFGEVVFIASAELIRTFDNFTRNTTPRWAVHEIHLKHPKPEYIGPGQDTISFTMFFDVKYGINPRKEMDQLVVMARAGQAEKLIVGGKGLGVNKWYIESLGQEWTSVDNYGNVLRGSVEVTMREYV